MSKEYKSHITKAEPKTTARGGRYVSNFDFVRSERGREIVDRHAAMAEPGRAKKSPEIKRLPEKVD